jgi:serine/threonine-protein kinase HipA
MWPNRLYECGEEDNVEPSQVVWHLRNHGFIHEPGRGWTLAPAYDMNPVVHAQGLLLNISEADNSLDLDLTRSVADYFRVKPSRASAIIAEVVTAVRRWPEEAEHLAIPRAERGRVAPAFGAAGARRFGRPTRGT